MRTCANVLRNALVGVCILLVVQNNFTASAQNFDIDILRSINSSRDKSFDKPFIFLDKTVDPLAFGTPVMMLATGYIRHDSALFHQGVLVAVSVVINSGSSFILKHAVDRERPYEEYAFIDNPIEKNGGSFPSGSTSNSFALATSLTLATKKWYVAVPAYAYAGTVGYSRLHLGVHYPSDVAAGALLGAGSAAITHFANKWLREMKN